MDRLPLDLLQLGNLSNIPVRAHHAASSSNVLLAAWRRRGLICGLLLLSLAGAVTALGVIKRQYVAESVLQLDLDKREGGQADERGSPIILEAGSIVQGELRMIRSRLVVRRVVDRLHLADDPGGPVLHNGVLASWLAATIGALPTPIAEAWRWATDGAHAWLQPGMGAGDDAGPAARRIAAAEDEVMSRMTAESDNRSYLVTIKYTSGNPEQAAQVANALAEEYIQRRLQTNLDAAGKTVEWLDAQIAQVRQALAQAESLVETYQAQSNLLELGTPENLGQQGLRDLSAQLIAAVVARDEAQARLARVQDAMRGGAPSADDMKGSPQIRSLLERITEARARLGTVLASFGAQHPVALQARAALGALDSTLVVELRRAAAIAQGELTAAQRTEYDLSQRRDAFQRSMISGRAREGDLRNQQAVAQGLRDRLAALTRNRDQVQAMQQLRPVAASLLVPAERPRIPASPKPGIVIPVSLAGGLGLGLVLATLLERRDLGLQAGSDVEPALGKRCLGMIPEVPRALIPRRRGRRAAFETSLLAETARSVGASLGLFNVGRTCRVVLVTSAVGDEGKSVFCQALAESLVASGRRVLLVDGSPCRTGNAQMVGQPEDDDTGCGADPGPAAGGQPSTGLTVIRRSAPVSVAADVFSTPEFAYLLEETRKRFDVVVLEGPAVLLVGDSLVLGRLADSVIHVARWSSTKRKTISAALTRLHESSVIVDGIVLTRVNLIRHGALKALDLGSYTFKEKRFYERLLRPEPGLTKQSRDQRA